MSEYLSSHGPAASLTVGFGNHFTAFDITFYYLPLSFSIQVGMLITHPEVCFPGRPCA